jgi:hypothetical protein
LDEEEEDVSAIAEADGEVDEADEEDGGRRNKRAKSEDQQPLTEAKGAGSDEEQEEQEEQSTEAAAALPALPNFPLSVAVALNVGKEIGNIILSFTYLAAARLVVADCRFKPAKGAGQGSKTRRVVVHRPFTHRTAWVGRTTSVISAKPHLPG